MSPPVYLVTGAAGLLGTAFVRLLRELGIERRCLDLAAPGDSAAAREPWLLGDLTSTDLADPLREFCRPVTHAVHLASRVTNAKDLAADLAPQLALETAGTLNLLRALPAGARHVAYASSMTVYGRPERLPVGEEHPLKPDCVYAVCKLGAERLLERFSRERGVAAAGMRLASVYGPGGARGGAIAAMASSALKGLAPEVFGDGSVLRDYLFVEDAARAILAVSRHELRGPVNVGTGRGTSLAELARMILRAAGLDAEPRFLDRSLDAQSASSMILDPRRLRAATDFTPLVPLEEGLARTLARLKEDLARAQEADHDDSIEQLRHRQVDRRDPRARAPRPGPRGA